MKIIFALRLSPILLKMARRKKSWGKIIGVGFIVLILLNLIGWAFYDMIKRNAENLLNSFGIIDPNLVSIAIIAGAIGLVLVLAGPGKGGKMVKEALD
jgi:hypothetical protein